MDGSLTATFLTLKSFPHRGHLDVAGGFVMT